MVCFRYIIVSTLHKGDKMMMMMIRCERATKSVERSHGSTVIVLWNQQVKTDRTIPNNQPDTLIHPL